MTNDFTVHFWGVRGSHSSAGPEFIATGGNTSCVEMRVGGQRLIFDAGTGIVPLGDQIVAGAGDPAVLILLSHYHHDHIQGLPHFPPLFASDRIIHIVAPWNMYQDRVWDLLTNASAHSTIAERPGLRARRRTMLIEGGERLLWNMHDPSPLRVATTPDPAPEGWVEITTYRSHAHPRGGSMCYRVTAGGRSAVFATDTESYIGADRGLADFSRDTDLIIHDAHFTPAEYSNPLASRQGWGHSTWEMAVELARLANIPQVALFHHDPSHTDAQMDAIEAEAQAAHPGTFVAREGRSVTLGQPPAPADV